MKDGLQAEAAAVGIFLFIDAERAVVGAVVRDENRDGGAACPGLVRMAHVDGSTSPKKSPIHLTPKNVKKQEKHRKIVVIFFTRLQKPRILMMRDTQPYRLGSFSLY